VRPVLLIDEAQQMNASVFTELRLLSSAEHPHREFIDQALDFFPAAPLSPTTSFAFSFHESS